MRIILQSYGRAFLMQFNYKIMLLSLLPSLLAVGFWAVLLYVGLQPLIDLLQQLFLTQNAFQLIATILDFLGLFTLKIVIVPFMAMWFLLPLMLCTTLLFVTYFAMPLINRMVSTHYYPQLEKCEDGNWWRSLGFALIHVLLFIVIWLISLPLTLFMPFGLIIHPILLGWLTYRIMTYDALAAHASREERKILLQQHRNSLWVIGVIAGSFGALPGLLWVGGVLSLVFLPLLAAFATWIYILVFMFSALWFQLFCLEALQQFRETKIHKNNIIF